MEEQNRVMLGITVLCSFCVGVLLAYVLIPALRRLKAGQEIREVGPNWHASKAGTPTMGGLVFIGASLLCLLFGLPQIRAGIFPRCMCWPCPCALASSAFWTISSR